MNVLCALGLEVSLLRLPFEFIEKVISLVPYLEILKWQGGEVFLLDYFKNLFIDIAEYAHITQEIATNGLLINKDWAEIFSKSKVTLLYSIDGVIRETYENIRRNGKFKDLLRSLDFVNRARRGARDDNVRLEMHVVVMRCNYQEITLFPDFCRKHDIKILALNVLWPKIIPEQDIFTRPDEHIMNYLSQIIPEIEDRCRKYNIQLNCNLKPYVENFYISKTDSERTDMSANIETCSKLECISPWSNLHVEPDGYVKPECKCEKNIGYLAHDSLERIWNSEAMQSYRNFIRLGHADKICSRQCSFLKA